MGALLLLVVALAVYGWFGIERARSGTMEDLQVFHGGVRALAQGENPYARSAMRTALGMASDERLGLQITLPSALLLLLPLAPLQPPAAEALWLGVHVASLLAICWLLCRLSHLSWRSPAGVTLVAAVFLLGPFRTNMWLGQVDMLALLGVCGALCLLDGKERQWVRLLMAGVLLAVAIGLKPQNAGLFAVLLMLRGRATAGLIGLIGATALVVAGALLIGSIAPEWLATWQSTAASPENVAWNRVDPSNLDLHQLSHLHVGLYALLPNAALTGWLAIGVLGLAYLRVVLSRPMGGAREPASPLATHRWLTELAVVALVSLLVVYHRFGTTLLIVFPLTWAMHALCVARVHRLSAALVLLACAAALANGQAAYALLLRRGLLPDVVTESALLDAALGYHYVWAQSVMLVLLMIVHVSGSQPTLDPLRQLLTRGRRWT